MIRTYNLALEEELIRDFVNNPRFLVQKLEIFISDSGFSGAYVEAKERNEPKQRKRRRYIRRFILGFEGNGEIDQLRSAKHVRILRTVQKMTEEGHIVLLDYEEGDDIYDI